MEFKFLSPTEDDVERLYYCLANSFLYYNRNIANTEQQLMRIYQRVKNNIGSYKLVKCGGEKAAYYYFHEQGDMMKLEDIHVLARFRNRGIGTSIVRRCISETEKPLCAELYYHNVYAMSLFRHNNFAVAQRIDARRCIVVNPNDASHGYGSEQFANVIFSGNMVFAY